MNTQQLETNITLGRQLYLDGQKLSQLPQGKSAPNCAVRFGWRRQQSDEDKNRQQQKPPPLDHIKAWHSWGLTQQYKRKIIGRHKLIQIIGDNPSRPHIQYKACGILGIAFEEAVRYLGHTS